MRAAALDPSDTGVLRHLSATLLALDQSEEATAFALRAVALAPVDRLSALHATELLLRTERFDEAAAIILDAVDTHKEDPVALRLLAATQMLRGRIEEASTRSIVRLALSPETAEYHLHRANLLYRLGRLDEAAEAFGRAAALDPSNPDAKRSQLTVYFDSGRFIEALADRRRTDPRLAGQRGICSGGAAGIEPPIRDAGRRLRRPERARLTAAPRAPTAARDFRDTAHPGARHPRPDHPRNPHPLRQTRSLDMAGHCSNRSCTS